MSDAEPLALTEEQIREVSESWQRLGSREHTFERRFYSLLFERDPSIKALFSETDMEQQQKKLSDTLSFIVRGLAHLEMLGPAIRQLGEHHVDYGVDPTHYATMKAVLLESIRSTLGEDEVTDETLAAWDATYEVVASLMRPKE